MNLIANFALLASRRDILGLPVCDFGWTGALSFLDQLASLPFSQTTVSFLNAHNANIMLRDADYREALQGHLVLPDGVGMDMASSVLHGSPFPANLNGTDFIPALLTYIERPKRIGLLGAAPGVVEAAAKNLAAHAPWHEVVVIADGFFDKARSEAVIERIENAGLDILIVGMGTPLQEKWVSEHVRPQHARLVLTVGALFDFMAGAVPRAPAMVRRLRLEWFYRMAIEPRRLWRRYVLGIPRFFFNLARYRLHTPFQPIAPSVAGEVRPLPSVVVTEDEPPKIARNA